MIETKKMSSAERAEQETAMEIRQVKQLLTEVGLDFDYVVHAVYEKDGNLNTFYGLDYIEIIEQIRNEAKKFEDPIDEEDEFHKIRAKLDQVIQEHRNDPGRYNREWTGR